MSLSLTEKIEEMISRASQTKAELIADPETTDYRHGWQSGFMAALGEARTILAAIEAERPAIECQPEPAVDDDGWSDFVHPLPGYKMQCCDCGLIHEMDFRIMEPEPDHTPEALNPGESPGALVGFRARRAHVQPSRVVRPSDPVELVIFKALRAANIRFTQPEPPDFLLDDGTAIECKRMFTERSERFLRDTPEAILIQGIEAARTFARMIGDKDRPAIEAAERERLAKLAEKRAASPGTLRMFTFHVTWRQVADFIRSQENEDG
jgi:hypothetical protein